MRNVRILIIEDDDQLRQLFNEFLGLQGFDVQCASNGKEGIYLFKKNRFDIILTDLKMQELNGLDVIKESKKLDPDVIGIIITGYGTIDTAVRAMKLGAFDYIIKPVKPDKLNNIIKKALEHRQFKKGYLLSFDHLRTRHRFGSLIGKSQSMKALFKMIEKIAHTDSTVLILGESGTGKELVARSIHLNSDRSEGPFVPVNCGAIPETLLESELFGHEKGSFTGASRTQIGRFEKANGGTIFLDEVGDMSQILQTKILRVLQEREFERIGGMRTIKADVRVIAATHRDLEKEIEKGNFRDDLYYRLNVIPIKIPPLRERKSDIPLLIQHFLQQFNRGKYQKVKGISDEAMAILTNYYWPGNVRELENLIERFVVLGDQEIICKDDFPEKIINYSKPETIERASPQMDTGFNEAVSQLERELIIQALNKTDWVKNKAAKLLHLKRTTLVEKIKKNSLYREVDSSI